MNIFQRIFSDTPNFFKKVRTIGLTIAGAGAAIVALPVTAGIAIPSGIIAIATHAVAIGTAVSVVAQSVYKTDPDKYDEK